MSTSICDKIADALNDGSRDAESFLFCPNPAMPRNKLSRTRARSRLRGHHPEISAKPVSSQRGTGRQIDNPAVVRVDHVLLGGLGHQERAAQVHAQDHL